MDGMDGRPFRYSDTLELFFIYDILIDDSNGRVDTVQLCRQFDRARREVDHVFVDMIMRGLDLSDADRQCNYEIVRSFFGERTRCFEIAHEVGAQGQPLFLLSTLARSMVQTRLIHSQTRLIHLQTRLSAYFSGVVFLTLSTTAPYNPHCNLPPSTLARLFAPSCFNPSCTHTAASDYCLLRSPPSP